MDTLIYLTAITLDFIGKFLLALLVILVHNRIQKEGKIDKSVLKEMGLEKVVGSIALILLIFAYIVNMWAYLSN
ncbi:hypothetical protein J4416_04050 [Candidatus Pacearchaeota archaeon]|nr:hypothetical protein [Candidatus Pacearchaeota archaeon]